MRSAIIYPFSDKSLPLYLYFSKFQPEYQITALVSPPGLGLAGHTPFHAANRSGESAILVQSEIEMPLQQCDALIVPFGDHKNDPSFCDAIAVMRHAAELGKEIFCCLKLTNSQRKEFKDICHMSGAIWHDGFQESIDVFKQVFYGEYKVTAPVVFVHDLGIEADSFEVTLSLAYRFLQDGYKVSVVGPKPEYNILGFRGSSLLLNMLYGHEFLKNIPRYIKLLQLYMHMVEVKENPDVILFHCPGAAVPMNDLFQNDSGVYTYLVSRAIRPDFSLVCMAYSTPTEEALRVIHTELEYQFGFGIDALHLSNRALHVDTTKFTGTEQHVYLSEAKALEEVCDMRLEKHDCIPVFNALSDREQELLYSKVINTLGSF